MIYTIRFTGTITGDAVRLVRKIDKEPVAVSEAEFAEVMLDVLRGALTRDSWFLSAMKDGVVYQADSVTVEGVTNGSEVTTDE